MTDLQMKTMVKEQFPFLSDEQYDRILEIIIEIEANISIDTFITLINLALHDSVFSLVATG